MARPQALLAQRYQLVRQVGKGGMGVVWEAWDERLERPVAVKQLHPQVGLTPEEAELATNRAMREARITARLHHRNAVPVFDVVEHEGQPCLIMQFLPSVPLSTVLKDNGPLGVHEAAGIGAQVASALAAAHQLGIVHRDVKPGNILIADDGTAMISDFGISHALGDMTLTSTGLVHGTPAYLAPEAARGADSSYASDVFSLGATLYAAVEGAPPFGTDPNSIALLYRVASGEFDPPQRAGALAPVLTGMLRTDPAARLPMQEVAARLADIEAGRLTEPATLPLPATAPLPAVAQDRTTTVRPRQQDVPPTSAAVARAAVPPVEAPPPLAPAVPRERRPPRGSRRAGWAVAAVALVLGLVVLGAALLTGQLGSGEKGTATDPTAGTSPTGGTSPTATRPEPSASSSRSASQAPTRSSTPSPSSSSSSATQPPSPTATPLSDQPTAAELSDAITSYYALVPRNTDAAWPSLTANYQRTHGGGRQAYDRFWGAVDRVSVTKVKATPPSQVEATITYQRGDSTTVERTSYRLAREGGILKIADSSVLGSG